MANEDPDSSPPRVVRLFFLPEYERAFLGFVSRAVDQMIIRKSPFLSRIKAVPSSAMRISRNTMPSGEVVENRPIVMALPFAIDFKNAVEGNLATIIDGIDAAAEEGLKTLMPKVSDYVGRLCDAAGTSTAITEGGGISHQYLLKGLENVELDFDEQGEPDLSSVCLGFRNLEIVTSVLEIINALPPRTREEAEAWNSMIERKRKEFNDRRRRRQLS